MRSGCPLLYRRHRRALPARARWLAPAPWLLSLSLLSGCAHTPPGDPADPLESINRPIFSFNQSADRYVVEPVARAYVDVTPTFARRGVSNFFANLLSPTVIVNDLLQAKFIQGGSDLGRFAVNSVYGLGGLIDVGSRVGLPPHDEDFGQTLGVWGVGPGWYLMLPLLGPSDNRDLTGKVADHFTYPLTYLPSDYDGENIGLTGLSIVDLSTGLLGLQGLIDAQFDPYVFVRSAYLQRRQALIGDGRSSAQSRDLLDPDRRVDAPAAPTDQTKAVP